MESAYDRKFEEMKKYIPFLESMIKRLESTSSSSTNPRQAQLDKIRSLRDLLLDKNKRMKMDNLLKCEQVLVNLYAKVEQRDSLSDITTPKDMDTSKVKSDLEIVRNKLKTAAKINDDAETLPEIARANDIELQYTGSKEPALFQRRPNITKSPIRTATKIDSEPKSTSPLPAKSRRGYTRVLVSPEKSTRQWPASEQSSSDKPLFSRRSPIRVPSPSVLKKDKKKSRKSKDLNITLNVPEESLNSLNTKDILSRIINCSDGDVDIATLRDLRTQILGELKQTGNNDDISDLILKSYKKKTKSKIKTRHKDEVEEGELSDSESEAIESIYSSLVVMDNEKKSHTKVKTIEDKDNQQRKIQICLVINSDKEESDVTNKKNEQPDKVIDLLDFEMYSDSEINKSKDIISIDSDVSLSPPKKVFNKSQINIKNVINNSQVNKNITLSTPIENMPKITNVIDVDNDDETNQEQKTKNYSSIESDIMESGDSQNSSKKNDVLEEALKFVTGDHLEKSPVKEVKETQQNSEDQHTEPEQKGREQLPKNIANFYKPIEERHKSEAVSTPIKNNSFSSATSTSANISINDKRKENDSLVSDKDTTEVSQKIPLLNEPELPPKAVTDVLSEIDILQALKNEILNGTISVPGSEQDTPALHQPKLTKVASVHEVIMPKKRISIEKYKEKTSVSTTKSLFIRKRNKSKVEDSSKKQSLKLTDKECERFNFPKRISLDEDENVEDLSEDDDFFAEDRDDDLGLDNIYGDLAPKSPDNEIDEVSTESNAVAPVIIPTDPIKITTISSISDVDMRSLLPMSVAQQQHLPLPVPPPLIPPLGFDAMIPSSPAYGFERSMSDVNIDQSIKSAEQNRLNTIDPRVRRDSSTPRSTPFSNVVPNSANMTPSRTHNTTPNIATTMNPNMTPNRTPCMTPSYMPSIPLLITPNVRSFEMTPSHQSFEIEESLGRKHVYAPSFSICDNRERELSVSKEIPQWDRARSDPRNSRRTRWEEPKMPTSGSKWESHDLRNSSSQSDASVAPYYEDSYKPKDKYRYEKITNRMRRDEDRRDCPATPMPSFGWSECPPTPGSTFGRQEAPMTPSHPFGRSECPSTPNHSFGLLETPITSSHSFSRLECPSTPSHPFGRSECPSTPINSFGRSDCPQTPSHPFGRPENSSKQNVNKDPRLNRRPSEFDTSSHNERDRDYESDKNNHRKNSLYKSQSRHYSSHSQLRHYDRESSVGRNDRPYSGDHGGRQYERNRREPTVSRSLSRNSENDRFSMKNRDSRYDDRQSKTYDEVGLKQNQKEKSVGRTTETKPSSYIDNTRSVIRAVSVGRSLDRDTNKDNLSFKSDSGRDFTINTSVKSTFQSFLDSGKPLQVFDYTFGSRKQRAASVGRSLPNDVKKDENSIVCSPATELKTKEFETYSRNRNNNFKRASSVGRELLNPKTERTFKEVKADFESYRSKLLGSNKDGKGTDKIQLKLRNKRDIESLQQEQKSSLCKLPYSPRKNYRDPRMRNETSVEHKSRYKIDRRSVPQDCHKSGIIYSSDNIAKGTIMGSGFGVKNYKIPKIKRAVVEDIKINIESKENTETSKKIESKTQKTIEIDNNITHNSKLRNIKDNSSEPVEETQKSPIKNKSERKFEDKNKSETKSQIETIIVNDSVENLERRVTRSRNKIDMKQSQDMVSPVKTKKSTNALVYDSCSDSEMEKEIVNKKVTQESPSKSRSPSKRTKNTKCISNIKESNKQLNEEIINSSFSFDDIEIFPENIGSEPVIENINALIADLDNDLDSSKISQDSLNTESDQTLETADNPQSNCLGDISEVIKKDLNETNEKLQVNSVTEDTPLIAVNQNVSVSDTIALKDNSLNNDINLNSTDTSNKELLLKQNYTETKPNKEVQFSKLVEENVSNDDTMSKLNEDVVSTTDQMVKINVQDVNKVSVDGNTHDEGQSIPDSTIKNAEKMQVGSPDSTIEMHCELSSDVTSTYDATEMLKKDSDLENSSQNEVFNSFGSLLSIIQHKSKIIELMSILGDQSKGNQSIEKEKIMKKLEKLSQILSDEEEDDNEDQSKINDVKKSLPDTETEEKHINKNSNPENMEDANHIVQHDVKEIDQKCQLITEKENIQMHNPCEDIEEIGKSDNVPSNEEYVKENVANPTDISQIKEQNCTNALFSEIEQKSNEISNEEVKTKEINESKQTGDEDIDDEPLAKTKKNVRKKVKSKKSNGKFKPGSNKNKPVTKTSPSKIQIKKTISKKKTSRELKHLQDSIKEMFMNDDIYNATGIRLCRLTKMGNDSADIKKEAVHETEPYVVLEKFSGIQNKGQTQKIRKKPGPKAKNKGVTIASNQDNNDKMLKPKTLLKYKPGPKCKTKQKDEDLDPYEFDADSVTTKESDDSSDSENESLASSLSFGSSEILVDKKKPKRKRRGVRGWQSGIIKPKNRKKKDQKQDDLKDSSIIVKPQVPIKMPDLNCFTDKTYCFQRGVSSYDCRLCIFSGTDIVNHYKKQHPHTEIPLSRMEPRTAELAIQQCEEINFQAISKIPSDKYKCRFCRKEFLNSRVALEPFFWHVVSNHTGEFKHLCSECVNVTRCPFNLDIPPPPKDGGQLIGYICGKCNFTQVSLENLKTHVIVRHNDEQTEVYTINMAVMSNKAMKTMLRKAEKPRVLRSLRSNQSVSDQATGSRDDHSDGTESTDRNSESECSQLAAESHQEKEGKQSLDRMRTKLTFENDEPSDDTSVKVEDEEHEPDDHDENNSFVETFTTDAADMVSTVAVDTTHRKNNEPKSNSDDIMDYPHFKLKFSESGAKEYVCCINGNDNHYKTSLLISMKKHVQTKHSEKWDGYCCICKAIVTLQGVQSYFKDCLCHFLDKHMDDFPVIETVAQNAEVEKQSEPEISQPSVLLALPARVATPPVERTASPSYIAVRPLAELLSKDLIKEIDSEDKNKSPHFPKIEKVISLGEVNEPVSIPSPVYPSVEPAPQPDKHFLYEDVQAEVMSKKHRVVLDAMMLKENLVKVYKCAGRFCSFTTDCPEDALLHASTHQRVGGEGALNCSYCNYDACGNGIDLVMHVFKDHSRCQFCCPLCFYRAAAGQLIEAHYTTAHTGSTLKSVLRTTAPVATQGPDTTGVLSRDDAVQYFVCNHDDGNCNFKTYPPGKFIDHLVQKHETATSHPCSFCQSSFPSPAELVVHLRSHGLRRYQCTWCVHGANEEQELMAHAASRHPDKQPQAYVRIITNHCSKDGTYHLRVLPLAFLNKSKAPVEDVAPNTTKHNPVREAERSIELEKLISHTMLMIASTTGNSEGNADKTPIEEPVELPPDLPESECETESTLETHLGSTKDNISTMTLKSLLTTTKQCIPSEAQATTSKLKTVESSKQEVILPPVKHEPVEVVLDNEIICLDSDDETTNAAELTLFNTSADVSNTVNEDANASTVAEISQNSVTDEVSITKFAMNKPTSAEDSRQNIIDLSDDESLPSTSAAATTQVGPIVNIKDLLKCPSCEITCKATNGFKRHIKKCVKTTNLQCPHKPCSIIVPGVTDLILHYNAAHKSDADRSTLNNFCGICKHSFTTLGGAKLHIRSVHKVPNYIVTMLEEGKFSVWPAKEEKLEPTRASGRQTASEIQRYGIDSPDTPKTGKSRKLSTETKKRYGIEDVDKLPINPILDTQVYCELCEFGTKVRLNMVRHLQLHASKQAVPRTETVNPVPHLETNEMYFDRMVNLASSSLARAADKPAPEPAYSALLPPEETARYPKYVPERLRYACGAQGCSYISVGELMFRRHWEALHMHAEDYLCVHCPAHQARDTSVPLSVARIVAHLRMHDVALYVCSVCSYYHYNSRFVEKHLADKHPGAPVSVRVVREPGTPAPAPAPSPVGAPTMDLKPWQCGLCKFSSMLRPEVVNHCGAEHQSKMQFKCGYCPFRTSTKENVAKHQINAHPTKASDIFYFFYREGSIPDEPDGMPRWQKQRQKLGLDVDHEVKTEPEPEMDSEQIHSAPEPPTTSESVDLNLVKKEIVEEPPADTTPCIEDICKKYGKFCEPDGIKYKCCLCNIVREHERETIKCHLYEELNYRRWECAMCSYKAFHKTGLNEHMASEHLRQYIHPRALPVDGEIEKWVEECLDYQTRIIETNKKNLALQKIQVERVTVAPPSPKRVESPKPINTEAEMEAAFGSFGAPNNQNFCCPKCTFITKDERDMVYHLESELTKIRWSCTVCSDKFQTFHEAQFHCKSAHVGQSARPKEAIRNPSLRSGWVTAVISSQKQFMKCFETTYESTAKSTEEDSDLIENSLLVARYDEPVVHTEEQRASAAKRPKCADSDDERLVIDEPPTKKINERQCPYCDFTNTRPFYVREHILRHYNLKPYRCMHCPVEGARQTVLSHIDKQHPSLARRVVQVPIPNHLPPDINLKPSSRQAKEPDDGTKTVCLYCEKSVSENETDTHIHANEKSEFAKRGEVVVKCCKCLVLRLSVTSLQEHFDLSHPGEKLNYAYFKLQVDTREIHCCAHCYKKFKFLQDLKAHHAATHLSLSFSYTSIPYSHNLHTENDLETANKRKSEDPVPSTLMKRVARKSTSKLPNSTVARKSTTKLPHAVPETEEYSYYGTKPLPFKHYSDVTVLMPRNNSTVVYTVDKLSDILKIDPRVVVKDYKS